MTRVGTLRFVFNVSHWFGPFKVKNPNFFCFFCFVVFFLHLLKTRSENQVVFHKVTISFVHSLCHGTSYIHHFSKWPLCPAFYKRIKDIRKETIFSHYLQWFGDVVIRLPLRLFFLIICNTAEVQSWKWLHLGRESMR